MTRQAFKTTDVLKLEVEDTPTGMRNLVRNRLDPTDPDLPPGAWGYITPLPDQFLEEIPGVPGVIRFRVTSKAVGFSFVATEMFPCSPGERVAGRIRVYAAHRSTSNELMRVEVLFLNAAKTFVGSTGLSTGYTSDGEARTVAMTAPANTAYCRLNITGYTGTGTGNTMDANRYVAFGSVSIMVGAAVPDVPTALGDPPVPTWTNILAPSHEIKVVREGLNLGTLTATIGDVSLHPATASTLRPGRPIRLTALEPGVGFKPLFTGQIRNAQVAYDLSQPRPERRARIHVTATDNVGLLANVPRPTGVTNMPDLRAVVEGCGVPWLINGDASQSPDITGAIKQDKATALDQISITRDSVNGYAWVNAAGVLVANDPGSMLLNDRGTFTASHYTDLGVDYDTAACINTVEVAQMTTDPVSGDIKEVVYGPYTDAASIAIWGPCTARFRTQGVANIANFAAAVLAANATPTVRVNSMRLPILTAAHVGVARARIDLYDTVTVDASEVGVQANRVTAIEHHIKPEKWLVNYQFAKSTGVASPMSTPSPEPIVQAVAPILGPATNNNGTTGSTYYMRDNKVVMIRVWNDTPGAVTPAHTVFTMPVGYRPLIDTYFWVPDSATGAPVCMLLKTTGACNYIISRSAGQSVIGAVTYIANVTV